MITLYVINEIGFEYNDETYNFSGDYDGQPVGAYLDKNKAYEECRRLNEDKLKNNPVMREYDCKKDEELYYDEYYKVVPIQVDEAEIVPNKTLKDKKEELREFIKNEIQSKFDKIFNDYTLLESIGFKIYTPSFNDGDPCYPYLLNDIEQIEVNGTSDYEDTKSWEYLVQKLVSVILDGFTAKDIENVWGTNNLIIFKRDGSIDTEDFYCD